MQRHFRFFQRTAFAALWLGAALPAAALADEGACSCLNMPQVAEGAALWTWEDGDTLEFRSTDQIKWTPEMAAQIVCKDGNFEITPVDGLVHLAASGPDTWCAALGGPDLQRMPRPERVEDYPAQ